eukprot:CAMPEP_0184503630 /NCGR_PEP_ID=MMETSP0113_2-20130426/52007_1 /TAXON_ID=91329 /ORGANISM="Norrisiella sphaerica, Strain BC52" /LENGTH=440 /DNA_ID=CAMNT_0026893165 /DNA_START=1434 /DNA_END=2752 /DNA_ORIENTATION=+
MAPDASFACHAVMLMAVMATNSLALTVNTKGGSSQVSWTANATLKAIAADRKRVEIPTYEVSLDVAAAHRWDHVAADYRDHIPAIMAYLDSFFPKWAAPIIEKIGEGVEPYFQEYGEEMVGLARALNMKVGDLVVMNLMYQLEHIGINCSNWNNTGPTAKNDPGCMDVDPKQEYCYCHMHSKHIREDGWLKLGDIPAFKDAQARAGRVVGQGPNPGLCSSIVARDEDGHIYHGRNLDWNLPDSVLKMAINVNFTKGGKTVFRASTLVGFVGVMNGMRPSGFSVSIDARGKGGKVIGNIKEALFHHGITPSQHLRRSLETQSSFQDGVEFLSSGPLIDEAYYIVAGVSGNEGAVISRNRTGAIDVWALNDTTWYRVQTNYDHWNPVPKADDRRTPEIQSMEMMGQSGVGIPGMLSVITKWPAYNHHTDYTGVFVPWNDTYV